MDLRMVLGSGSFVKTKKRHTSVFYEKTKKGERLFFLSFFSSPNCRSEFPGQARDRPAANYRDKEKTNK